MVITTHQWLRHWISGLGTVALTVVGIAFASPSAANDDCVANPALPQCVQSGAAEPGDFIVPVAPPLGPGAPIITVDGDFIVPVAPPLGPGAPIITVDGDFIVPVAPPLGPGAPIITMGGD